MKPTEDDFVFWERLADMPDLEAEQELMKRREWLSALNKELMAKKAIAHGKYGDELGVMIMQNSHAFTRLNDELKIIRQRMDRLSWKNAVRAVFGDEGVDECIIWMQAMRGTGIH